MDETLSRPIPKSVIEYKNALRAMTMEMRQLNKKIQEDQAVIELNQAEIAKLREETRALLASMEVTL